LAVASACKEAPHGVGPISASGGITPLCQLGCVEEDPNPRAPGVFLGSGVTPDNCIMGGYTDADQDGLGDLCEEQLSYAFLPELYYYSGDDVRREPYWVARGLNGDRVRIGYLFSYYRDLGCPMRDCVVSRNPSYEFYGSGREECYWGPAKFRGWVPLTVGGGEADVYRSQLTALGF
jgi:hypothetical protein